MTSAVQTGGGGGQFGRPSATGLADVIDTILDKGLVIDAYVRVSLVGIELLTIDARVVVSSVDTYLKFAEAVNRLDISNDKEGLPELVGDMEEGGAQKKTKGALEAAGEKLRDFVGESGESGESDEDDEQERSQSRRGSSSRRQSRKES
jgi:gas vesicle structural protein